MSTPKAVLFDVGNTLVSYYRRDEFAPVLESCVHNALAYLRDHGLVFEPAVVLESAWQYNTEREDQTVVALEERLAVLLSLRTTDHPLMPGLVAACMAPNLALARAAPDALATLQALRPGAFL
jgi:FMN phosphatase YigB (HAD superfamily)